MQPHLFAADNPPVMLATEFQDLSGAVGAAILASTYRTSAGPKGAARTKGAAGRTKAVTNATKELAETLQRVIRKRNLQQVLQKKR